MLQEDTKPPQSYYAKYNVRMHVECIQILCLLRSKQIINVPLRQTWEISISRAKSKSHLTQENLEAHSSPLIRAEAGSGNHGLDLCPAGPGIILWY